MSISATKTAFILIERHKILILSFDFLITRGLINHGALYIIIKCVKIKRKFSRVENPDLPKLLRKLRMVQKFKDKTFKNGAP